MASPALTSGQHDTLDPQRKAQYTIHIPPDLLHNDNTTRPATATATAYASVRYNHKPSAHGARRTAYLRAAPGVSGATATLLDQRRGEGQGSDSITTTTTRYAGSASTAPKQSFVLLFDAAAQTATLRPLAASYSLNLLEEGSGGRVATQYAQLREAEGAEDVDDGGELAEGMLDHGVPDPENPFDFRHFLDGAKEARLSPSPALTPTKVGAAAASVDAGSGGSAARERARSNPEGRSTVHSTAEERRPTPRIRVQRKATDDTSSSAASSLKSRTTTHSNDRTSTPAIPRSINNITSPTSQEFDLLDDTKPHKLHSGQPDNKQAVCTPDDDDYDDFMGTHSISSTFRSGADTGLEIDFGDEGPPPARSSRARAITLPGSSSRSGRPISLRSAANSPGSRVQTPRRSRLRDLAEREDEEGAFELGGSGRGRAAAAVGERLRGRFARGSSSDEDADGLAVAPLPVLFQSPGAQRTRQGSDADDDDDENEDEDEAAGVYNDDVEPMELDDGTAISGSLRGRARGQQDDVDSVEDEDMQSDEERTAHYGNDGWGAVSDDEDGAHARRVQEESESESEAE